MFKRVVTIIFTVALALSLFCIPSYADSAEPFDLADATKQSLLTISGTTATCKSIYTDTETITSIKAVQTLEKHSFLWFWDTVGGEWTKTVNNARTLSFTNTKSSLASGTYRVKTVFTVTLSSGATESTTVYSSEVTI